MLAEPIETIYRGIRFRSRLEARWAVFLDSLNCSWVYESEGYELPFSGRYLPDFHVHNFPMGQDGDRFEIWIEVKGTIPNIEEINKLRELVCLTGIYGYFAVGTNKNNNSSMRDLFRTIVESHNDESFREICGYCIAEPLSFPQVPHSIFSPVRQDKRIFQDEETQMSFYEELDRLLIDRMFQTPTEIYYKAALAALSSRFEHGECGSAK
jgi:hypothetical protein